MTSPPLPPLFSWKIAKDRTIQKFIDYNKTQARAQHKDFKIKHPDEARDANTGNYTKLIVRCRKEITQKQEKELIRRTKNVKTN